MRQRGDIHFCNVKHVDNPAVFDVRRCIYVGETIDEDGDAAHVLVPGYENPRKMGWWPFHKIQTTYRVLAGSGCRGPENFSLDTHLYRESIREIKDADVKHCVGRIDDDMFFDEVLPVVDAWASE